jgi:hypothetical protein
MGGPRLLFGAACLLMASGCGVPDVVFYADGGPSDAGSLAMPDSMAEGTADAHLDAAPPQDASERQDAADAGNSLPSCQVACDDAGIGTCDSQGVCVVTCSGTNACGSDFACPAGVSCRVVCTGTGACGGNVDCSQSSACDVQCTGTKACTGSIACGGTTCSIECSNTSACGGQMTCDAGTCQVDCSGTASCGGMVTCSGGNACTVSCGGPGACRGGVCCQDTSCTLTSVANGC